MKLLRPLTQGLIRLLATVGVLEVVGVDARHHRGDVDARLHYAHRRP